MNLPPLRGIHHIKLSVSDLDRSEAFYTIVFDAKRIKAWDHRHADGSCYGYILEVPGLGTRLELRLNPEQAEKDRGFDPLTIAVDDRAALDAWAKHLDAAGVQHSPVLTAIQGWVLVFEDPDARRLRLYTLATHGPEIKPDANSPWLQ
jgi:catechol 2,3-dioxygenase-like lactoylglutathione lyase family enzyme